MGKVPNGEITSFGWATIGAGLQGKTVKLDVSDCDLNDEKVVQLGLDKIDVTKLCLEHNSGITSVGWATIGIGLHGKTVELDVSCCCLNDKKVSQLGLDKIDVTKLCLKYSSGITSVGWATVG